MVKATRIVYSNSIKSVESYREKLEVFEKWIEKGYLISATDLDTLNDKYDNDLNKAFIDNENYMINKLKIIINIT